MITIRVASGSIQSLTRASNRVKAAVKDIDDRHEVLQEIKEGQNERWLSDFLAGGNPTWEASWNAKHGLNATMMRTGNTLNHFISQNEEARLGAANVLWAFSNAPPASTVSHHTGYTLGGNTVPARTMWEFHPRDEEIIGNLIEEWFAKKLGNLF